jgi:polyisoprenoid-binding protein YceI
MSCFRPRRNPLERLLPALLALALLPGAAAAQAQRYELDPVHTRVMFGVSHAGFSNALGTVSGSTGELWFDADDWSSARLSAIVPIARVDLGDAKWNDATLARNLLDAGDYPEARFVSTRIEPRDATHATVHGQLTLRGVTREVALQVTLNGAKRHPMPPFRRTVGFSATTMLSRKAFGISAWPSMIGDQVELRIEAEATRARGGGDGTGDMHPVAPSPAPADPGSGDAAAEPQATPPATPPDAPLPPPTPDPTP